MRNNTEHLLSSPENAARLYQAIKPMKFPVIIECGRGNVILQAFKDRTSLAINIGHCGYSVLLSKEQLIELSRACWYAAKDAPTPHRSRLAPQDLSKPEE